MEIESDGNTKLPFAKHHSNEFKHGVSPDSGIGIPCSETFSNSESSDAGSGTYSTCSDNSDDDGFDSFHSALDPTITPTTADTGSTTEKLCRLITSQAKTISELKSENDELKSTVTSLKAQLQYKSTESQRLENSESVAAGEDQPFPATSKEAQIMLDHSSNCSNSELSDDDGDRKDSFHLATACRGMADKTCSEKSDSSEDDDYIPIKQNDVIKILRLCEEHGASDVRVLQNPYSWMKLSIVCDLKESEKDNLKAKLAEGFPDFEIQVSLRSNKEATHQLGWQASLSMKRESISTATCELIVHPKTQKDKSFAVGPAHVLFCKEVNLKAMSEECDIEMLRADMNSDRSGKTVWLQYAKKNEKLSVTKKGHVFYRYRYPPSNVELPFHRQCLMDAFLLPLEPEDADRLQRELFSYNIYRNEKLKAVTDKDELQRLHDKRTRIAVKNFEGRLYSSAHVDRDIENRMGLRIQFFLDPPENKLVEGDSGSIVYYIAKKIDGRHIHMPFGMVVQKDPDTEDEPFDVYNAVALSQLFKDAQEDYPDLADLQPYHVST